MPPAITDDDLINFLLDDFTGTFPMADEDYGIQYN